MAWGKIDDKLWGSPKWLATGPRARALWVTALSWSMDQLTDGIIPTHVLPVLGGSRRDAGDLCRAGLWEEHETGWAFHDWADYQPSKAKILAEREAAAERQKRARQKATDKKRGNETVTGAKQGRRVGAANPFQNGGTEGAPQVLDQDEWASVTAQSRRESRRDKGVSHGPPDPTRPTTSSRSVESPSVGRRDDEPPPLEVSIPRHRLPASWAPTTTHKAKCLERGIDLTHELHQFRSHAKARAVVAVDWDAEFDRWLGNARPRTPDGRPTRRTTDDKVRDGLDLARRLAADQPPDTPQIGAAP